MFSIVQVRLTDLLKIYHIRTIFCNILPNTSLYCFKDIIKIIYNIYLLLIFGYFFIILCVFLSNKICLLFFGNKKKQETNFLLFHDLPDFSFLNRSNYIFNCFLDPQNCFLRADLAGNRFMNPSPYHIFH